MRRRGGVAGRHLAAEAPGCDRVASVDQAKRWYTSPEYTEARRVRQGAANFNMLVVEGV